MVLNPRSKEMSATPLPSPIEIRSSSTPSYEQLEEQLHRALRMLEVKTQPVVHTPQPFFPKVKAPSTYRGENGAALDNWERELTLQFRFYGQAMATGEERIRFAAMYLGDVALQWWMSDPDHERVQDWDVFLTLIRSRFRPVQAATVARNQLRVLQQSHRQPVNAYVSRFQTLLASITDMGVADQVHNFISGLQPHLRHQVYQKQPVTMVEAVNAAVVAEGFNVASFTGNHRPNHTSGVHPTTYGAPTPMDLGNVTEGWDIKVDDGRTSSTSAAVTADQLREMEHRIEAKLNAIGQGGSSHYSGPNRRTPRSRNMVEGLSSEQVKARLVSDACIRCGKQGHWKNECPEGGKGNQRRPPLNY